MHPNFQQTFQTVGALLDRFEKLGGLPPDDWIGVELKVLSQRIRLLEARCRNECHEIITEMIRGKKPRAAPTEIQAYFICCRCRCALDTMMLLDTPKNQRSKSKLIGEISDSWTEEDLLEWLLNETWDGRHDVWMKLTAFAVVTGNKFYSG